MLETTTKTDSNLARQIAKEVGAFEHTDGRLPKSATVLMRGYTLVITLEAALTSIEQSLVQDATGAAQVQAFYEQLISKPHASLWERIRKILGRKAGESDEPPANFTFAKVFPNGTVVHVYLLAEPVRPSTWSESWTRDGHQGKSKSADLRERSVIPR